MDVTVLYVSGPATIVGALSRQADPGGAPPSPGDLTGSSFPVRADGAIVPVAAGLLGVASIDPTGVDGVFDDPGGYTVAFGADGKPSGKLTAATNPSTSPTITLSRTNGFTVADPGIQAGASALAVLQDTTSQAAPLVLPGTTLAGQFHAATPLAPGPWNVAWFIEGSRPGTVSRQPAT